MRPSALRLLDAEPRVRLLFTDVGLPGGLNGRQLADEARRRYSALRIHFATGYARNALLQQGKLGPSIDLVTKPFTYASLGAKIRAILDRLSHLVWSVAGELPASLRLPEAPAGMAASAAPTPPLLEVSETQLAVLPCPCEDIPWRC
jgi:CheY-like chemotaxis protein